MEYISAREADKSSLLVTKEKRGKKYTKGCRRSSVCGVQSSGTHPPFHSQRQFQDRLRLPQKQNLVRVGLRDEPGNIDLANCFSHSRRPSRIHRWAIQSLDR